MSYAIPQLRRIVAVNKKTGEVNPKLRPKPPQPTIIRRNTAKRLAYLEQHGLADFSRCCLSVAMPVRIIDPHTGVRTTLQLPTGGV